MQRTATDQLLNINKTTLWIKKRYQDWLETPVGGHQLGINLKKYSFISEPMKGLRPGLYCIVAKSHVGKTTFMIDLALDVLRSCEKTKVIYLSLDDMKEEILTMKIANLSKNSKLKVEFKSDIDKNEKEVGEAYEYLMQKSVEGRYHLTDLSDYKSLDDVENYLEDNVAENQTIIFIDGIANLNAMGSTVRDQNIRKANSLMRWANVYKMPIFATMEVPKMQYKLRPTKEDIAESVRFSYNAKCVICMSPVDGKQFAPDRLRDRVLPIMMFDMDKNKFSGMQAPFFARLDGLKATFNVITDPSEIRATQNLVIEHDEKEIKKK